MHGGQGLSKGRTVPFGPITPFPTVSNAVDCVIDDDVRDAHGVMR